MISSGIIMTLVICQFIKIIIDLIIRGCALHELYGWSMKLLGAFFSLVTHLLVVLNKENTTQNIKVNSSTLKTPTPRNTKVSKI